MKQLSKLVCGRSNDREGHHLHAGKVGEFECREMPENGTLMALFSILIFVEEKKILEFSRQCRGHQVK